MEEAIELFSHSQEADPNIQMNIAQYINIHTDRDLDFDNTLISILKQDGLNPMIYHCAAAVLKLLIHRKWKCFSNEKKKRIFDDFKELVFSIGHPSIISIAAALVTAMTLSRKESYLYDSFIFLSFNNIGVEQPIENIRALTSIIRMISHHYRIKTADETCEPHFLFKKIQTVMLPLLDKTEFLSSSDGCEIIEDILLSFKYLFVRIHAPVESSISVYQYCQQVVANYSQLNPDQIHSLSTNPIPGVPINPHLIGTCISKIRFFYNTVGLPIIEFIPVLFSTLSNSIQTFHDQFILYKTLQIFSDIIERNQIIFEKHQMHEKFEEGEISEPFIHPSIDILQLFISASQLDSEKIEQFSSDPNVFYSDIYSSFFRKNDMRPLILATTLVSQYTLLFPELINSLLSTFPTENVIRCISILIEDLFKLQELCEQKCERCSNSSTEGLTEDQHQFLIQKSEWCREQIKNICKYAEALVPTLQPDDPIRYSSGLFFINKILAFLDLNQQRATLDITFSALQSTSIVVNILGLKLFTRLIKCSITPPSQLIELLISVSAKCPTKHAANALQLLATIFPDAIHAQVPEIAAQLFSNIQEQLQPYIESNGQEDISIEAIETIQKNITLITQLVKANGDILVQNVLFEFIKQVLTFEDGAFFDKIAHLATAIVGTKSIRHFESLPIIIEAIKQNTTAQGFAPELLESFFYAISLNPAEFLDMGLSVPLAELCTDLLNKSDIFSHEVGDMLSWLCQITPFVANIACSWARNQLSTFAEISESFKKEEEEFDISLLDVADQQLIAAEIIVSNAIREKMTVDPVIFGLVVKMAQKKWMVRIYDKFLFAVMFLLNTVEDQETAQIALTLGFGFIREIDFQINTGMNNYYTLLEENGVPDNLLTGFDSIPFKSPVENINLSRDSDLIKNALSKCSPKLHTFLVQQFAPYLPLDFDPLIGELETKIPKSFES